MLALLAPCQWHSQFFDNRLTPPHAGHLVAQAPDLELVEQGAEFHGRHAHFLLIIHEAARQVIGNGVVILAHVGEHAQEALAVRPEQLR